MMKNGEWCDTIMIKAIASMWSIRISVIYANNFTQVKFHHDVAACQADIVLLYNGHYIMCMDTTLLQSMLLVITS